jgi:hypothetical protein
LPYNSVSMMSWYLLRNGSKQKHDINDKISN